MGKNDFLTPKAVSLCTRLGSSLVFGAGSTRQQQPHALHISLESPVQWTATLLF
jgi:hypothetical protein